MCPGLSRLGRLPRARSPAPLVANLTALARETLNPSLTRTAPRGPTDHWRHVDNKHARPARACPPPPCQFLPGCTEPGSRDPLPPLSCIPLARPRAFRARARRGNISFAPASHNPLALAIVCARPPIAAHAAQRKTAPMGVVSIDAPLNSWTGNSTLNAGNSTFAPAQVGKLLPENLRRRHKTAAEPGTAPPAAGRGGSRGAAAISAARAPSAAAGGSAGVGARRARVPAAGAARERLAAQHADSDARRCGVIGLVAA